MKTSKNAMGGGARASKLLAAMAILAVAFVVLAAVPVALTDADANATAVEAPTFSQTAEAVASVSDIKTNATYSNGVVTLSGNANWTLSADITIKQLNLAGHSLKVTSKDSKDIKTLTIENSADVALIDAGSNSGDGVVLEIDDAGLVLNSTVAERTASNTIDASKSAFYLVGNNADFDINDSSTGKKTLYSGDASKNVGTVVSLTKSTFDMDSNTGFQCAYFKLADSEVYFDHAAATTKDSGSLSGYFELSGKSVVDTAKAYVYAAVIGADSEFDVGALSVYSGSATEISNFWSNAAKGMTLKNVIVDGTLTIADDSTIPAGCDLTVNGTLNLAKDVKLTFAKSDGKTYSYLEGGANSKVVMAAGSQIVLEDLGWKYSTATTGAEAANESASLKAEGAAVTIEFTQEFKCGAFKNATVSGAGATLKTSGSFAYVGQGSNQTLTIKTAVKGDIILGIQDNYKPAIVIGEGGSYTGTITQATFSNQVATAGAGVKIANLAAAKDKNVTIQAGSIEISGNIAEQSGTSITVLTEDVTVPTGKTLTVPKGATLVVSAGASLAIAGTVDVQAGGKLVVEEKYDKKAAAAVTITGSLTAESGSSVLVGGSITADPNGTVVNNTTITVTSKDAVLPTNISGTGSVDSSSVISEGTQSGEWNTVTTYTQNQVITLTGDTTLVEGSQIIMQGKLVIPEGITLTIENGAQLVVYTSTGKIENSGTILVKSAAGAINSYPDTKLSGDTFTFTGGLIVLYGTIVNDGLIQLDYTITGDSKEDYATNSQLNIKGKVTNNGQIHVGAESYLNLGGEAEVVNASSGTITVEGQVIVYTENAISNAGAVVIDGAIGSGSGSKNLSIAITGTDGYVQIESVKSSSDSAAIIGISNGFEQPTGKTYTGSTEITVTVKPKFTFSGLQVTASMVKDSTDTEGKKYLRYVDVAGQPSIAADEGAAYTEVPVAIAQAGYATVSAELALPAGVELTIGGDMKVAGTMTSVYGAVVTGSNYGGIALKDANASLTVTGKVTASAKDITPNSGKINAAYYSVAASGTVSASYVYTTLDQAVSDGATKIAALGATSVSSDVTVPSGTTVTVNSNAVLTVDAEKTLTFVSGAVLKNVTGTLTSGVPDQGIVVKGTLYVEVVKTGLKPEGTIVSEVVVKGETDRMYTTLATAIGLASAGSTIELSGDVTLAADLTIPAGITVDTNEHKVTVPVDRTLTIDGELYLDGSASTLTMGAKDTTKIQNDGKVVLNGTISSTDAIASKILLGSDAYTVGGAYYTITVGAETTYYVEPVSVATESITLADDSKLEIRAGTAGLKIGDVSFAGTSTASATVEVYTKLVASSITLDLATVSFKADSAFEGTITDGVGSVALVGTAKTGFAVASSTSKNVKSLAVSGQFVDTDKDDKFAVSGEVKLNGVDLDKAIVDGTAKVSKASTVDNMTVNGTVSVDNGVKLTVVGDLEVLGTLSAAEMTDDGAAAQVEAGAIYVGITKKSAIRTYTPSTAAAAAITGKVTSAYVLVADGSSVPDSIVKADGVGSTAYTVDGKAYVTAYATGNSYIGLVKASAVNGNFEGWYAGTATTTDVSGKYVGASGYEKVSAIIDYEIYTIYVLAEAGIENLAIDGNLMVQSYYAGGAYTATSEFKAGTHTITYTLKNGYSGTAKLALVDSGDVTASVSGMTVNVSGDEGEVVLQLTGIEKSGYVDPVVPEEKDNGLTVTDYLLIVLVILVVVLAVIVALRLMRS